MFPYIGVRRHAAHPCGNSARDRLVGCYGWQAMNWTMPRPILGSGYFAVVLLSNALGAVAGTAGVTSVPLEIVNNFPVLMVSVGDQKIPVAFDLGGDEPIELTTQALEKIKVEILPDAFTWLDAKGNKLQARQFRIAELRIGGLVFHDVAGHEDAEAANYPRVRAGLGRVGISLIQSYSMVFDYSGKTLTLFSDHVGNPQRAGCFGVRVPFDLKWEGAPVSTVQTDLGNLTFVWDTGAPGNFIAERLLARRADDRAVVPFVSQRFVMGGRNFGPQELRPSKFVQPEGADGFLGYSFFAHHFVCVDLTRKAFWIRSH
jgi:hypothetical protein